jgi:HPt (histidine-containing phosphotransfer) domain-containing protein
VTVEIDKEALLENFMEDEELLTESIDLFLERVEERYKTLSGAIRDKDIQKVMEEGHTIKGMVGIFEKGEVFEAAKKLEFMGRDKNLEGAEDALSDFRGKLDQLCSILLNLKNDL